MLHGQWLVLDFVLLDILKRVISSIKNEDFGLFLVIRKLGTISALEGSLNDEILA